MSYPQRPHGLQPTRLLYPWDFPGKSTGTVECYSVQKRSELLSHKKKNRGNLLLLFSQSLSHMQLFVTPWIAAGHVPLSSTISQSLLKFMSIESVMPSNHPILCSSFSFCLQSFPASGFISTSRLFASGGQSLRVSASASVLPMNIQD